MPSSGAGLTHGACFCPDALWWDPARIERTSWFYAAWEKGRFLVVCFPLAIAVKDKINAGTPKAYPALWTSAGRRILHLRFPV